MASSTPASDTQGVNVSLYPTLTARLILCKGDISITIGMVCVLILYAMQGRGLCSASWMCPPVSFDGRGMLVRKAANLFGCAWTSVEGRLERVKGIEPSS